MIFESQRQMIMIYAFRTSINTKISVLKVQEILVLTTEFLSYRFENAISTDLWSADNPCWNWNCYTGKKLSIKNRLFKKVLKKTQTRIEPDWDRACLFLSFTCINKTRLKSLRRISTGIADRTVKELVCCLHSDPDWTEFATDEIIFTFTLNKIKHPLFFVTKI